MSETATRPAVKPLPTPSELNAQLTAIISGTAQCKASWAQHPGPLELHEFLAIKAIINRWLTEELSRFIAETHPK